MDSLDDGMCLLAFRVFQAEDNNGKGKGCRNGDGKIKTVSFSLNTPGKTVSKVFLFILKRLGC